MAIDLSGKTALVTGGGQGLGAAAAGSLGGTGANVAVNYFADPGGVNRERAEQTAQRIGTRAMVVEADVRDGPQVEAMIEQTIRQTLPEGFQRSEFLLEHGMLDNVVPRHELKETVARCIGFFR